MDKINLKLEAGQYVVDSNISKLAKVQLLNFIKEAEEEQLMALMLDDEIVTLDEQAKEIIRDRFDAIIEKGGVGDIVGYAALIALLNWRKIYRKAGEIYDKQQACKHLQGSEKVACKKKFMVDYIEGEIKRLNTKKEQVCKGMFKKICINNVNAKIDRLVKRLNKEKAAYKAAMNKAKAEKKK